MVTLNRVLSLSTVYAISWHCWQAAADCITCCAR